MLIVYLGLYQFDEFVQFNHYYHQHHDRYQSQYIGRESHEIYERRVLKKQWNIHFYQIFCENAHKYVRTGRNNFTAPCAELLRKIWNSDRLVDCRGSQPIGEG
ncbi:hypothetical protein [uncultured Mobiluncus sp.]|uniref:hypothetical protein n=1 Tax=uncultured Mobiluncus sp. TaxID=293425 RepID=UPI00262DF402|nr:hypothetical protein [uncultured Mobiluncus sp.]